MLRNFWRKWRSFQITNMFNANIKYIHRSNLRKIVKYKDRLASAKKQYMNDLKKGFNQDSV